MTGSRTDSDDISCSCKPPLLLLRVAHDSLHGCHLAALSELQTIWPTGAAAAATL
jgi:hypothetical protein